MVEDDPFLGPVRYCATCSEWWPDDEEFWKARTICRACRYEQRQGRLIQLREAARRYRARHRDRVAT